MIFVDLTAAYLTDSDSPFHGLRHVTKLGYARQIERLNRDMGHMDLATLRVREIKHLHDAWSTDGKVAMGHSLITQFKIVTTFGATILEDPDCARLRDLLTGMRFKNSGARKVWLDAEQATATRDVATRRRHYAIALAQALQQDCAFRQKDVIGEWVPLSDPEPSEIVDGHEKWVRGITREEVGADLILRHQTSKRGKEMTFDLTKCKAVMEEWFSAPKSGPLIIDPETGLPYQAWKFRRIWRELATEAGVPKNVWNMDSRAGRITGVIAGGATIQDAKQLAGHSQQSTTERYARGGAEAIDRALGAGREE